jgi:hypothetical protein
MLQDQDFMSTRSSLELFVISLKQKGLSRAFLLESSSGMNRFHLSYNSAHAYPSEDKTVLGIHFQKIWVWQPENINLDQKLTFLERKQGQMP